MDPLVRVVEVTGPLTPKMAALVRSSLRWSAGVLGAIFGGVWLLMLIVERQRGPLILALATLAWFMLAGGLWLGIAWSMLLDLRMRRYRVVAGPQRIVLGQLAVGEVYLGRVDTWTRAERAKPLGGTVVVTSWTRTHKFAFYDEVGRRTDRFPPYKPDAAEREALEAAVAAALASARTPPPGIPPQQISGPHG